MSEFIDVPKDMEVQDLIVEKLLQRTGAEIEVRIVKRPRQYEAALFMNKKYLPGPPLPRPIETPSGETTHWMGVRPKIGLTAEEVDKILYEVNGINALYRITMKDTWGQEPDY
ncbi:MAG: hypothetical protein FD174_1925 [Geobacteraceae bacterium]|nr:MAG: hypothetical protein FD174_1925 [Geobacteraceae bacterium]